MTTARAGIALLCIALGAALFTAAEVASAKVVRWDLQNVTLPDGSAASGAMQPDFSYLIQTQVIHLIGTWLWKAQPPRIQREPTFVANQKAATATSASQLTASFQATALTLVLFRNPSGAQQGSQLA